MLKRREFFRLSLLAGLTGITGCGRGSSNPTLGAASETLPKEMLRVLPDPWIFKPLEAKSQIESSQLIINSKADLLAIGDGWISELQKEVLQPISAGRISSRLNSQAKEFMESFGPITSTRIFPIGVSPWVMLFRNGQDLLPRANEGWNILLDPKLTGRLVLPESPRLVMSIANRIEEDDSLRRLRQQAITFDDRNSLNWILSGKARVAILPLSRCFSSLSRDARLSIAVPQRGAPLHWTILVCPIKSAQPFPQSWIEEAWTMPLLGKLLARGWMPPLQASEFQEAIDSIPDLYKKTILPDQSFWERSWSLPSLSAVEINRLTNLWIESTP